jgi:UDPglucose 6-dehydrogenase
MEALWEAGAKVQAFDPVAMDETRRAYGGESKLVLAPDKYAALEGADALAICTEWQQFRAPDFSEMASRMKGKLIVDGRNLYAPERLQSEGWEYLAIGRSARQTPA